MGAGWQLSLVQQRSKALMASSGAAAEKTSKLQQTTCANSHFSYHMAEQASKKCGQKFFSSQVLNSLYPCALPAAPATLCSSYGNLRYGVGMSLGGWMIALMGSKKRNDNKQQQEASNKSQHTNEDVNETMPRQAAEAENMCPSPPSLRIKGD
ncbi:unnamed protein product [Ceratitis capitata]|uniref:(Mediterranean fruit fly) hypothetical protein n=1 Tax=Ceratitis capitata TaxID=7213 RepID=A0A811UPF8_CERCA|nr:unnamed protein product [Ceratitis capitata]